VEAAISAMTLATGLLPPTYNLDDPDPQCPLDHVLKEPRQLSAGYVLSNSVGFGGQNVSLLLGPTSGPPRPRPASSDAAGNRPDDQPSSEQQGIGT
jgi:3-oxoacyl-[acyl-carrier-protein] synthase II